MIRRVPKFRLLLGFAAVLALAVVAACGSAEEGLTKAELEAALAAAAQPAPVVPSAAEISELVSAAVAAAAPAGVSSADIAAAVEAAVSSVAGEAVTAAEIEALVGKAVEDAVSGGPTPLSPSQVEAIVASAIAAIPAPEPILVPVPAPAPPAAPQFRGTAIVVTDLIHPPTFLPSEQTGSASGAFSFVDWGFYDYLLRASFSSPPKFGGVPDSLGEGIAQAWELSSDRSKLTFTLNPDAEFHGGWGKVRAADVKWSFEEGAKPGNKNTRASRIFTWIDNFEAVDDSTVIAHLIPGKLDPRWTSSLGNHGGGSVPIVSKRLFDEKGEDGARRTEAGSGVVASTVWRTDDEVRGEPVANHWRRTPEIEEIRYLAIPEISSRIAAMRAGEANLAWVPIKQLDDILKDMPAGARVQQLGHPQRQVVYFGGNFWARTGDDGESIFPRPGLLADADHPWIGDPGECKWDDNNSPTNACLEANESMQNAKKVRSALYMAVDREAIKEKVFGGRGDVIFTWNLPRVDPNYKESWEVAFDIDMAKQLLSEAGVKEGLDITMWVAPDNLGGYDPEGGEVVAQMWRALGLNVTVEKTKYAARRPSLVARSIDIPMLHHSSWLTLDEPRASTVVPSPGFNHAIEMPDAFIPLREANFAEPDYDTRLQNNFKIEEFMQFWRLVVPYTTMESFWIVGPDVEEWRPHQMSWSLFNSPETVVMKQ